MKEIIEARKPQTKVKHIILEKYLKAWGGIILKGLGGHAANARRYGKAFEAHFVYIDCNASCGRYDGEQEDVFVGKATSPVWGSPIIGIDALDSLAAEAQKKQIELRVNAILIEKEKKQFNELKKSLEMRGFQGRVKETQDFSKLQKGEIAIVGRDSTSMATDLIRYTQSGRTFSFFFLDPYGPDGIPLPFVQKIISQPHHDSILNMMYQDLHKKTGYVTKADQSERDKRLIENYDEMFGTEEWQTIVSRLNAELQEEDFDAYYYDRSKLLDEKRQLTTNMEHELINLYGRQIQNADHELTVKFIPLRFPDKERTMYYLYLTTHDCDGAMAMNRILWDAIDQEYELRWGFKDSKPLKSGQLKMLGFGIPPAPERERLSQDEIMNDIYDLMKGKTVTLKDVCRALVSKAYFKPEVDKAIEKLKALGRVSYDGKLNNTTVISFKNVR